MTLVREKKMLWTTTSPFDIFYQSQSLVDLQKSLLTSQKHFEKMIDKDRTNFFLGLIGQNIQSAGRRVEQDKARLKEAWAKMEKALEATKATTSKFQEDAKANRDKAKECSDALAKLDVYDSANYKEVNNLKKQLKELDNDHEKLTDNIKKLENITKLFS
jgi:chromosome segregation ATPase